MKIEKKHYWIIGVAGVITTTGIILYVRHKKKKAAALIESEKKENSQFVDEQGFIEEGENENHLKRDEATGDLFPLQYGSKNESVAALQKYINSTCPSGLKKAGVFPLLIDGTWNDDTETAALACSALRRNKIDRETFERISRDLLAANIV